MGSEGLKRRITSPEELEKLVEDFGFLPFFQNEFEDFSVEEYTPEEYWFAEDRDGPWQWKGEVIRSKRCVYGKFFKGKAGFISMEWLPDFLNYRRDGYDFDARFEDGLASRKDKEIYETVLANGALLTRDLKRICGYGKRGKKGFDTVITRLQMQTYLTVMDFEYARDKAGTPYGWGIARYSLPEVLYGEELVRRAYKRQPEESKERIFKQMLLLLPDVDDEDIWKLIG